MPEQILTLMRLENIKTVEFLTFEMSICQIFPESCQFSSKSAFLVRILPLQGCPEHDNWNSDHVSRGGGEGADDPDHR